MNKSTWCLHCTSYYHTTIYWLRVPSQILFPTHIGFLTEFLSISFRKAVFFISIKMFVHIIKRFESLNMVWWHAGIQSNSRWKNDGFLKWNIDFWIDFTYSRLQQRMNQIEIHWKFPFPHFFTLHITRLYHERFCIF